MQSNGNFYSEPRVSTGSGFNPYDQDEEDLIDDLGCDDAHDQEFDFELLED